MSSLYAFDALSRAARSQVNKHAMTGDINSEKGNCATFLLKVEGILEGLFQDMTMIGTAESKVSSPLANHGVCPYDRCLWTYLTGLLLRGNPADRPSIAKNQLRMTI